MPQPPIGIGHLTMMDVSPPDFVTLAARTGFDVVGVRVAAGSPGEQQWPMEIGSPMLADTLQRMADTGVRVSDVEIIRLSPETRVADYRPLFDTGAALGASFINVIGFDPDPARARDTFAALVAAAAEYHLRPSLEAMPYSEVHNLADAVAVIDGSGGGLVIDPLHLARGGNEPAQVAALDPKLFSYYQLCDAPARPPSGLPRPARLPRDQPIGTGELQLEARAYRLLPGDGDLPLAEIVAAMPADLPVSLEAPNLPLIEQLGSEEFARRAHAAMVRTLAATGQRV